MRLRVMSIMARCKQLEADGSNSTRHDNERHRIALSKQSHSLPIFRTGMGWTFLLKVIGQQQLSALAALAAIKAADYAVGPLLS